MSIDGEKKRRNCQQKGSHFKWEEWTWNEEITI